MPDEAVARMEEVLRMISHTLIKSRRLCAFTQETTAVINELNVLKGAAKEIILSSLGSNYN